MKSFKTFDYSFNNCTAKSSAQCQTDPPYEAQNSEESKMPILCEPKEDYSKSYDNEPANMSIRQKDIDIEPIIKDINESSYLCNASNSMSQVLSQSFIYDIMMQENPDNKGLKDGIFYEYQYEKLGSGIGFGHKITYDEWESKKYANGITKDEAKKLLESDLEYAYNEAEKIYNEMKNTEEKPFNECSINAQQVATDLVFDKGQINSEEIKKFMIAMAKNDMSTMKIECKTAYWDSKENLHEDTERNEFRAKILDRENNFRAKKRTGAEAGLDSYISRRVNIENNLCLETQDNNNPNIHHLSDPSLSKQPEEIKTNNSHAEDTKQANDRQKIIPNTMPSPVIQQNSNSQHSGVSNQLISSNTSYVALLPNADNLVCAFLGELFDAYSLSDTSGMTTNQITQAKKFLATTS